MYEQKGNLSKRQKIKAKEINKGTQKKYTGVSMTQISTTQNIHIETQMQRYSTIVKEQ